VNVLARLVKRLSAHPRATAATVAFGVGTLGAGVGLSATSGWLIAMAALMPGIAALQVAVTGVRAFGLARGALRYGERLSGHGLSLELLTGLRLSLFDALERRSPALLMHRGGDLLHRWVQDVDSLRDVYVRGLHAPLLCALVFALASLGMLSVAPRLALVFAGWFFLSALFLPVLFHRLAEPHQVAATRRRADLSAHALDLSLGRDELILAGAWERRSAEARELTRRLHAAQGRVALLHALRDATGVAATSAAVLSVFFLAWPLVSRGQLSGVALVALVLATASIAEAILPVSEALVNWGAHRESAQRVFAVEDEPIPAIDPPHPRVTKAPPHAPGIRFQGVSFTWPGGAVAALDGLTLEIAPGEHLAITGASGAGKSTLLSLLVRAHDPNTGAILLDGMDLRDWSLPALRQTISWVSQATWFAPGSLRDNLRLAKPGASDDEMRAALRESGLSDWLRALPQGFDTPMGSDGERLSGGERQRLSLARALLRASPVLALDELTANLDREAALEIHDRLGLLTRRQTVLRITHDPALHGGADRVLVMGDGKAIRFFSPSQEGGGRGHGRVHE
jgi:thiol reductant ABC exporter CydC subunit